MKICNDIFTFFLVAIFDRSGRHVITGSDDRLVKIWSMETAFCLASCRGHEVYPVILFHYLLVLWREP